jgi:chromosome segregation ATPase
LKSILLLLIVVAIVFAQVETVSVGKIDKRYSALVSQEDLIEIIKEIEILFEKQLGFNVFDYSQEVGKPIDILYMPPSQKKKKIVQNQKKSELLKKRMSDIKVSKSYQQTIMDSTKKQLESQYKNLNRDIQQLNSYVSRKNSSRNLSKNDYETMKRHVSKEQSDIKMRKRALDRKKRQFNSKALSLRNKVNQYNSLISRYNHYQRDIERLSKSYKEIKGKTKKRIQTTNTTYTEDGKSITKQDIKIDSEKIEIYDFENLNLLKVILAHEIGHLVGVKHIDNKGALMHPELQKKQINHLSLTADDIQAFQQCFSL